LWIQGWREVFDDDFIDAFLRWIRNYKEGRRTVSSMPVKSRFASARSKKTVYAAAGKSRAFNVVVVIVGDVSVALVGERSLVVYVGQ
jgi:hypothetical protein